MCFHYLYKLFFSDLKYNIVQNVLSHHYKGKKNKKTLNVHKVSLHLYSRLLHQAPTLIDKQKLAIF